jgi:dienelactone hydrolase
MMICLGVVPFGVDHPQVPRLGAALARAGFAALMYWSPTMRDRRLDPEDIENIALAYDWLVDHPAIDATRSGLMGTCVGGSFALMAAASPRIRDRVAFVVAYAPYSSMWTLTQDIVSATRAWGPVRRPWPVDPLTRTVYVRSLTDGLAPHEAELLRRAALGDGEPVDLEREQLSTEGRTVAPLLGRLNTADAEAALQRLPAALQERLAALSPLSYVQDIQAPLIVLLHDRDDVVIPVGESRRLKEALAGRAGVSYTEFTLFQHMDPSTGRLSPLGLLRQLGLFYRAVYPVFRLAAALVRS